MKTIAYALIVVGIVGLIIAAAIEDISVSLVAIPGSIGAILSGIGFLLGSRHICCSGSRDRG